MLSAALAGQKPLPVKCSVPLLQSAGSCFAPCIGGQPFEQLAALWSGKARCCHVDSVCDQQQAEAAAAHLLHGLGKHPSQHLRVSRQHVPAGQGSPLQPFPLTGFLVNQGLHSILLQQSQSADPRGHLRTIAGKALSAISEHTHVHLLKTAGLQHKAAACHQPVVQAGLADPVTPPPRSRRG